MGRLCLLVAPLLIALLACSPAPAPPDTAAPGGAPEYLGGIETEWSVPIERLGDLDLLGPDSVMREALVAGDRDLLLAATVFRQDDVYTLDLVVLNKTGSSLRVERRDLHLLDAEGRWLSPLPDHPAGADHGLRGRGRAESTTAAAPLVLYDLFDPTRDERNAGPAARTHASISKDSAPRAGDRDRREDPLRHGAIDVELRSGGVLHTSPVAVQVHDGDGKVFWGYFRDEDPRLPLTAMVLVNGQQYLFRFDD